MIYDVTLSDPYSAATLFGGVTNETTNRNATTHSSLHTVKAINDPNVATKQCVPTSVFALNGPTSYAKLVTGEPSRKSVNFHTLLAPEGNGVAYFVVDDYVKNSWSKYGLVKSMLNSSNGLFFFKFSYKDGMDAMLENGPWFIRNTPFILKMWNSDDYEWKPSGCLSDKVFGYVLDECPKKIVLNMLKNLKNPRQAIRGVPIGPKVGFKPTKQIHRLVSHKNGVSTTCKKKQVEVSRQEASNLNPFHVLNSIENDDDLERIDKSKIQTIEGKLFLVDDERKPLPKVVSKVNVDCDSEVEEVFLEQWRLTKWDDDYDSYNDDMYDSHDISDNLQVICDDFDIMVRGRKKK
ncbi:putative reverse transcriptase domain-containing protein [Tanacetum coccineum]